MGKPSTSCKRKRHHGKRCKCKKCVVKYREIRCVKTKTTKQKYDINIRCNRKSNKTVSDVGEWNAGLVYPAGSGFVNAPNNKGRYVIVNGQVHATTALANDGPGRAVKTDFSGAALSLPVPAADNGNFNGVILHVSAVPDGGKTLIARSRLKFSSQNVAQIGSNATLIATNEDLPPPVRPCYQVWIKVSYDVAPCFC